MRVTLGVIQKQSFEEQGNNFEFWYLNKDKLKSLKVANNTEKHGEQF